MIRLALLAALLPAVAAAQTAVPAADASAAANASAVSSAVVTARPSAAGPVEHRLSPDEIAAAQADGETRSRAAELLAMRAGDPSLALPGEKAKRVHGEAGFGLDSLGGRTVFGSETTTLDNGMSLSIAGDYTQFGRRYRPQ